MVLFLTGGVALGVGLALGMMMRSGRTYDEGDEALGEYQRPSERFVGGFSVSGDFVSVVGAKSEATPG